VHLVVELLDSRSRHEWENSLSDKTEPPTYAELQLFLDRRLRTLESTDEVRRQCREVQCGISQANASAAREEGGQQTRSVRHVSEGSFHHVLRGVQSEIRSGTEGAYRNERAVPQLSRKTQVE